MIQGILCQKVQSITINVNMWFVAMNFHRKLTMHKSKHLCTLEYFNDSSLVCTGLDCFMRLENCYTYSLNIDVIHRNIKIRTAKIFYDDSFDSNYIISSIGVFRCWLDQNLSLRALLKAWWKYSFKKCLFNNTCQHTVYIFSVVFW